MSNNIDDKRVHSIFPQHSFTISALNHKGHKPYQKASAYVKKGYEKTKLKTSEFAKKTVQQGVDYKDNKVYESRLFVKNILNKPSCRDKIQGAFQGIILSVVLPTASNPFRKLETIVRTNSNEISVIATLRDHPYKGLQSNIALSGTRTFAIFFGAPLLRPQVEELTKEFIDNPHVSTALATSLMANTATILMTPGNTLFSRLLANPDCKTILDAYKSLPEGRRIRSLYKGMPISLIGEAIYWFPYRLATENFQHNKPAMSPVSELTYNVITGGLSGAVCSRLCHFSAVIGDRQRVSQESISALRVFKDILEKDPRALSRGWWVSSFPRAVIGGVLTNLVIAGTSTALTKLANQEIKRP